MKFCQDCGNLLTPSEKKGKLIFECGTCGKEEQVLENNQYNNLVYRNEIKLIQNEVKINPSIINDPTYARTYEQKCPKCGYEEAICFQNPNINEQAMKLMYLCCNKNLSSTGKPCGYHWFKEKEKGVNIINEE